MIGSGMRNPPTDDTSRLQESRQSTRSLTPEQYIEIERAAEFKSEYFDGRMFAMSGGTYVHARLITAFTAEICQACPETGHAARLLRSSAFASAPKGLHPYPDIAVVCGEPAFADDQKDTLLNPVLIVEVLSKSTEAMDRGLKFREYRKIDSLREYVLVSQTAQVRGTRRRLPSHPRRL